NSMRAAPAADTVTHLSGLPRESDVARTRFLPDTSTDQGYSATSRGCEQDPANSELAWRSKERANSSGGDKRYHDTNYAYAVDVSVHSKEYESRGFVDRTQPSRRMVLNSLSLNVGSAKFSAVSATFIGGLPHNSGQANCVARAGIVSKIMFHTGNCRLV